MKLFFGEFFFSVYMGSSPFAKVGVNIWNQIIDSTILGDRKPLITNNMMFSKNSFCVSWSFGMDLKRKSI
jgi:hypothetical protein